MVTLKDIQAFVERIARNFHPERIILFGSYAWGKPTPHNFSTAYLFSLFHNLSVGKGKYKF